MPNNKPFITRAPDQRWAPTQSQLDAFNNTQEKLLPPLVHSVRVKIAEWRENNYHGASRSTKALLEHWFETEHQKTGNRIMVNVVDILGVDTGQLLEVEIV
jgi:type III restriction enzyme